MKKKNKKFKSQATHASDDAYAPAPRHDDEEHAPEEFLHDKRTQVLDELADKHSCEHEDEPPDRHRPGCKDDRNNVPDNESGNSNRQHSREAQHTCVGCAMRHRAQ